MTDTLIKLIPWLPALGCVICLVLGTTKLKKISGYICALSIFASFILSLIIATTTDVWQAPIDTVTLYDWIAIGGLNLKMGYAVDSLSMIMMLVVTGIGSLIGCYAIGYMKGDGGVGRFFAAMSLFIWAMLHLVMGSNLLVLFLGWEGVGLCSFLLIGHYFQTEKAKESAKKAFIVNRIGDLGLLIGMFLFYSAFGSLNFADIYHQPISDVTHWALPLIPVFLMIGAFGKSAQLPLYVWLPDAMAGPTPVSALVHAATMVTAGIYLISRLMPVFEASPTTLLVIACIGGATAVFAGIMAVCENDLKGVFAYSTVSQLGYMFLALGCGSVDAGIFHLITHAFFKALLFLTAGSVMHALAGQLDIRTMSGLGKRMPVTKWLMFIGCLALAGAPLTAGFVSKDAILAAAFAKGDTLHTMLGWLAVFTAGLTAFYTFRLWFIIFTGEERFKMGNDHHAEDDSDHGHAHAPHEMPFFPMNIALIPLAIGSLIVGIILYPGLLKDILPFLPEHALIDALSHRSGAFHSISQQTHDTLGISKDPHTLAMIAGTAAFSVGLFAAALLYIFKRALPAKIATGFGPIYTLVANKFEVDNLYNRLFVKPLWLKSQILYLIDQLCIDGGLRLLAHIPVATGKWMVRNCAGRLQAYTTGMIFGIAILAIFFYWILTLRA